MDQEATEITVNVYIGMENNVQKAILRFSEPVEVVEIPVQLAESLLRKAKDAEARNKRVVTQPEEMLDAN